MKEGTEDTFTTGIGDIDHLLWGFVSAKVAFCDGGWRGV